MNAAVPWKQQTFICVLIFCIKLCGVCVSVLTLCSSSCRYTLCWCARGAQSLTGTSYCDGQSAFLLRDGTIPRWVSRQNPFNCEIKVVVLCVCVCSWSDFAVSDREQKLHSLKTTNKTFAHSSWGACEASAFPLPLQSGDGDGKSGDFVVNSSDDTHMIWLLKAFYCVCVYFGSTLEGKQEGGF